MNETAKGTGQKLIETAAKVAGNKSAPRLNVATAHKKEHAPIYRLHTHKTYKHYKCSTHRKNKAIKRIFAIYCLYRAKGTNRMNVCLLLYERKTEIAYKEKELIYYIYKQEKEKG